LFSGLLLVKAAAAWKDAHSGQLPKSSTDRSEFKDMIRSWQRKIDDCPIPEENFTEAIASAHKVWAPPSLKSEVKAIIEDEAATNITANTADFWVLAAALGRFINTEGAGQPPLEGSLPDMHATTQRYLDLQRIYKEKSEADIAAVTQHVAVLLKEKAGKDPSAIPAAEIKRFCRHARQLRVVRSRPLVQGLSSDALRAGLSAEDTSSNTSLLILLRAVDRFLGQYQRFPGKHDNEVEEDVALLKGLAGSILLEAGVSGVGVCDDLVGEIVRCGGGELQVIGATVGAIASQEAIKLLTKQFVPLGGTLIYNAMQCTTSVLG
jgi:amyloid beta precursor protein binding protein 1